jgi:hypothetical protein
MDQENNIDELCGIINLLVDSDVVVLYHVLLELNEKEQIYTLRKMRDKITAYPSLLNAYYARTLVEEPNKYVHNEIIKRNIINLQDMSLTKYEYTLNNSIF